MISPPLLPSPTPIGIDYSSDERQIKLAYRKLALKYHPDKNREAGAEDYFKIVTSAYSLLMDEVSMVCVCVCMVCVVCACVVWCVRVCLRVLHLCGMYVVVVVIVVVTVVSLYYGGSAMHL
jgi:preprotein translocase subunit Sec63